MSSTRLFSLLDTNNFISEEGKGLGFFMSVSRESNFFFTDQVDQKYFLYIHEVKDTCIRDLKYNCVLRVTGNTVSEKG
jgi:hypothetical protein